MRFRITILALAGMVLAMASPALAGQVNLMSVTTASTFSGTHADTITSTIAKTEIIGGTVLNTVVDTLANTAVNTNAGSYASTNTQVSTLVKTLVKTHAPSKTMALTLALTELQTAAAAGTYANTGLNTLVNTTANTLASTGSLVITLVETVVSTSTGSHADTILETIVYNGQPADVSIEVSQAGMNYTSPFGNELTANALTNNVSVAATEGLTQINANSGNANVSVATNAILDGGQLVAMANEMMSEAALKELGVLTLVPGFATQNSNAATVAHMSGLALAAAEGGVVAALDVAQSDVNEYSPHANVTKVASLVSNNIAVRATAGINQVQANAGGANVSAAHNVLLVNTGPGGGSVAGINQ